MDALPVGPYGGPPLAQHHTPWAAVRPHIGMQRLAAQAVTAGLWDVRGSSHGRDGLAIQRGVRRQTGG
mgnify:CR=1 FL=1